MEEEEGDGPLAHLRAIPPWMAGAEAPIGSPLESSSDRRVFALGSAPPARHRPAGPKAGMDNDRRTGVLPKRVGVVVVVGEEEEEEAGWRVSPPAPLSSVYRGREWSGGEGGVRHEMAVGKTAERGPRCAFPLGGIFPGLVD